MTLQLDLLLSLLELTPSLLSIRRRLSAEDAVPGAVKLPPESVPGALLDPTALENLPAATGLGDELVPSRALVGLDTVGVEVVLEFRVRPGVEGGRPDGVGSLGESRGDGRVGGIASGGSGI